MGATSRNTWVGIFRLVLAFAMLVGSNTAHATTTTVVEGSGAPRAAGSAGAGGRDLICSESVTIDHVTAGQKVIVDRGCRLVLGGRLSLSGAGENLWVFSEGASPQSVFSPGMGTEANPAIAALAIEIASRARIAASSGSWTSSSWPARSHLFEGWAHESLGELDAEARRFRRLATQRHPSTPEVHESFASLQIAYESEVDMTGFSQNPVLWGAATAGAYGEMIQRELVALGRLLDRMLRLLQGFTNDPSPATLPAQ